MNNRAARAALAACAMISAATLYAPPVATAKGVSAASAPATTVGMTFSHNSTNAALQQLARDIELGWAAAHPMHATDVGLEQYDDRLDTLSPEAFAADAARIAKWRARLAAIDASNADLHDRDDALLLATRLHQLDEPITVTKPWEKDPAYAPLGVVDTLYTMFLWKPVAGEHGGTRANLQRFWRHTIARMEAAPQFIADGRRVLSHPGNLQGVVGAKELAGAPGFLNGALTAAAKADLPPAQFPRFETARNRLDAALKDAVKFIKARVAAWPENFPIGKAAYEAHLREAQLLPFDARDLGRMGYDELAHGEAEQAWVESVAAQEGKQLGPATGGGIIPSGERALIAYYRRLLADLRNFVVKHRVATVPSWLGEIKVIPTPEFQRPVAPGPSAVTPRLFSNLGTGYYQITPPEDLSTAVKTLSLYVDFDRDRVFSTAGHEAIPGHIMQFGMAHRNPDFVRRAFETDVFAEGWAYYTEEMFVRLGLVDSLDARWEVAGWEKIRGCRAIVDPKLASGEWTYQEAVTFFARNAGVSRRDAEGAVAGIALDPGSVISYTAGRYQLEALQAEYRHRMGRRASLLDFDDRLLSFGTLPFAIIGPELLRSLPR